MNDKEKIEFFDRLLALINEHNNNPERMPISQTEPLVPRYDDPQNKDGGPRDGQDKSSIPDCAYYDPNDCIFRSHLTGHNMGKTFFERWKDRRYEFGHGRVTPKLTRVSKDQRIVSRELLVRCQMMIIQIQRETSWYRMSKEISSILHDIETALQIEKPVLRAPYDDKI